MNFNFVTRYYYYFTVVCIFLLSACTVPTTIENKTKIIIPINTHLFNKVNEEQLNRISFDEQNIFNLTKEQQKFFFRKYDYEIASGNKPHEAVSNI